MTVAFDTLKFVETLEQAQIPRDQARAIVGVVRDAHDGASVASKADLREMESATDSKFELLRKNMDLLRSDMQGEHILVRWMLGILTAGVGTILAKLFWG